MPLTRVQITELAAALYAAHPDVDRLSLSRAVLCGYLRDLFGPAAPQPDDDEANAIRWHWMLLSDTAPAHSPASGEACA